MTIAARLPSEFGAQRRVFAFKIADAVPLSAAISIRAAFAQNAKFLNLAK